MKDLSPFECLGFPGRKPKDTGEMMWVQVPPSGPELRSWLMGMAPRRAGPLAPQVKTPPRAPADLRVKSNLIEPDQAVSICPVPSEKYSVFPKSQISLNTPRRPPHLRGVSRSSRTRGWMRWPQAALLTRALCMRTAKSCGPDASTPASSLRDAIFASDGDKKARSPGRARHKP